MKFLTVHNEFVCDLSSNSKKHHFLSFHIIQYAQVANTQFKFSQWVGPQAVSSVR